MAYTAPDHYSYNFRFKINKLPAEKTDKISGYITCCGILFGMMFVILGAYEILAYLLQVSDESYDFDTPINMSVKNLFVLRYSFDTFILLFGLLIVSISIAARKRYKTIYFDGENVKITHQHLFGKSHIEKEKLYNYQGVLLKIEHYQFGLINRNRYIIELYHKEKNKRVPLYISTRGHNIRKIWDGYAEKLRMPALFMTDHGLVSRHHNELNSTLKELSKRWHLNVLYREEEHAPASIRYRVKADKVIIKEKKLFFDIYSILAILGLLLFGSLLVYSGINHSIITEYIGMKWFVALIGSGLVLTLLSLIVILTKDVIVMTPDKLILGHNFMFIQKNAVVMDKDDISVVDIGHNPITDRYYISIISHNRNIIFGKNMPIDDLRWIRGCIIREIVR